MNRCPKCDAVLSPRATHCTLCFTPLNRAAAPPPPLRVKTAPMAPPVATASAPSMSSSYNWKHVFILIFAVLWILEGSFLILTAFVLETAFRPMGAGGFGFLPGVMGLVFFADGLGVIFGQDWAFSGMKAVCVLRIIFGSLQLLFCLGSIVLLYPLFSIAISAFILWLLNHAHD